MDHAVFYVTKCHIYWGLTHMVFVSTLIITHTETHTHTHAHRRVVTQGSIDWHTHVNIYSHQMAICGLLQTTNSKQRTFYQ